VDTVRRIVVAVSALAVVIVAGTVGYLFLGFGLLEATYQTVTTVATVGFREVRPMGPAGEIFTMVLILFGVGTVLYNLSVILEAVTEGHLRQVLERRRMDRRIAALRGHVIICGYGRVGAASAEFLRAGGHQVVIVDADPERLEGLIDEFHLTGDVNDDAVLRQAGIAQARAVIIALDSDADTVYATLTARAMRPDIVIVSRARTTDSKTKLELAGATRAVNPQRIGGRRLAAFALQPHVAEFLDVVMHDDNLDWRIQQVAVGAGSPLAGQSVSAMGITERTGALLLAVRRSVDGPLEANPPGDLVAPAGAVMIALGSPDQLDALAALGSGGNMVEPETIEAL
jgi:voltage-gated potassium channel